MKKVFSFVAAIVAVMVMAVSCMSENDKNTLALSEAITAKDMAKVAELTEVVKNAKDVTADQASVVLMSYIFQYKSNVGEAQAKAYNNLVSYYETAKGIKGIEAALEDAKKKGLDINASVDAIKAEVAAAAEAAVAAEAEAAAAAEAEAAEAEAEEE